MYVLNLPQSNQWPGCQSANSDGVMREVYMRCQIMNV